MNRLYLGLALVCAAAPSYAQSTPGTLVRDPDDSRLGAPRPAARATTSPGADPLATPAAPRAVPPEPTARWRFDPSVGVVYARGDFRWATWGFAERLVDPGGADRWRRVRQGMEVDLPRVTARLRPAFVYEVDFTDNDFFRAGAGSKVFENLFVAVQDADDAGRFRALVGENTHVISREDNLASGNLPAVNRSLVLEEHGSVNSFGTQFGVQVQRALSPRVALALSAQDNRGSLNTDDPRWAVGNSLAAKLTVLALRDEPAGRRLTAGVGVDHTRAIRDRRFTPTPAIAAEPLGATEAVGDKLSVEADAAYTSRLGRRLGACPFAVEAEGLVSAFSGSGTRVAGGYVQARLSLFGSDRAGSLDPFVRLDVVRLGRDGVDGSAVQQAWRAGANDPVPHTGRLVGLHLEVARNTVRGPAEVVPARRSFGEVRFGLRVNTAQYLRY